MADSIARAEHKVDVGDGLATSATVIAAPDAAAHGDPPIAVFAFPGAGYGRRYFDLQLGDLVHGAAASYSQAEHHARRGIVLIACDHLGCGESDGADGLTLDRIVAANAATAAEMRRRLASGEAAPGLRALRDFVSIAIGQSMGGCFTVVTQSRHRAFDAVAVLGYSAHQTRLPQPDGAAGEFTPDLLRYGWHWEDVPPAVVDEDLAGYAVMGGEGAIRPWRSPTVPGFVPDLLGAGYISADAAAIDVPVFVAAGERDVVPDLRAETSAYRCARDVTVFELPRSAHMHNFAGTRALLWDRLVAWYRSCAALAGSGVGFAQLD
jgi:pimeloyl-ACP methyl ester carboxylesterase